MTDVQVGSHGPPGGRPVLLVHGIGVSRRYFDPLARVLARTHRVLAPDLPGFGGSGRPRPALGIAEQAAVVARVVDRAGLARPLVVGHSMGTQVATELALAHPEHVGALVLVGPVADPSAPTAVGHALRLARDTVAEPPRLAALVLREYVRSGVRSYAQTLPHMLGYPLHQRVAGVRAPVAVVRGSRDPIASREFVELLARTAPCGEALEVPGARHLAMASHPHAVAAVCRRLEQRPP